MHTFCTLSKKYEMPINTIKSKIRRKKWALQKIQAVVVANDIHQTSMADEFLAQKVDSKKVVTRVNMLMDATKPTIVPSNDIDPDTGKKGVDRAEALVLHNLLDEFNMKYAP